MNRVRDYAPKAINGFFHSLLHVLSISMGMWKIWKADYWPTVFVRPERAG